MGLKYYLNCWKDTFHYRTKATRSEFNWFLAISIMLIYILYNFDHLFINEWLGEYEIYNLSFKLWFEQSGNYSIVEFPPKEARISHAFGLLSIFPLISVTARRLNDLDESKWKLLFFLLPIILPFGLVLLHIYIKLPILVFYILILISFVYVLYLLFKLTTQESNRNINKS